MIPYSIMYELQKDFSNEARNKRETLYDYCCVNDISFVILSQNGIKITLTISETIIIEYS